VYSVRRPVLGLAFGSAVLAIAAACGGAPAAPSGVPTVPPVDLPSGAIPSIPVNPDTALEALFPDTIDGHPIEVESAQGEGVTAAFGGSDPTDLQNFIGALGANMSQVSAGMSFNIWPVPSAEDFTGLTMVALRVQGVPAANTAAGLIELVKKDVGENAEVSQQTISGKTVTAVVDPEDDENVAFIYPAGDVVFLVGGTPNHVEEAFSKLP